MCRLIATAVLVMSAAPSLIAQRGDCLEALTRQLGRGVTRFLGDWATQSPWSCATVAMTTTVIVVFAIRVIRKGSLGLPDRRRSSDSNGTHEDGRDES
jgi:hypothetical protein